MGMRDEADFASRERDGVRESAPDCRIPHPHSLSRREREASRGALRSAHFVRSEVKQCVG